MAKQRTGETLWFKRHSNNTDIEIRWHLSFDDGTVRPYAKRGVIIPNHLIPAAISHMQKLFQKISSEQAVKEALKV